MSHIHGNQSERGQSLVEILLALSLAVVAIATVAYLVLGAGSNIRISGERTRVAGLGYEGISAARSITDTSFANLSVGTHGLRLTAGAWTFSGTADVTDKYTRQLTLSAYDADIYILRSDVTWPIRPGQVATSSVTTYLSNWQQTAGEAAWLEFATDLAAYDLAGSTLNGLTVENTHTSDTVTLTELTLTWDGSATLSAVTIGGQSVFVASTSSPPTSGDTIDITDTLFFSGDGPTTFGPIEFSADMNDSPLLIAAHHSDGSTRYARVAP